MTDGACIVICVRYPEGGTVKSRLAAACGAGFVGQLYGHFVADSLDTLEGTGIPFIIAFDPPGKEEEMKRRFGKTHVYMPQEGTNLGERMYGAFHRTFARGYTSVILIGSDIPDLPGEFLAEARSSLDGHDAVMGPARDGGYYLIGFRRDTLTPRVFDDIPWGTATVFADTMAAFTKAGYDVHLLPEWYDTDRADDLRDLVARNSDTPFARSRTMAYLRGTTWDGGAS